jgi:hypothetical protein
MNKYGYSLFGGVNFGSLAGRLLVLFVKFHT